MKKLIAAVLKELGRKPAPQPGWIGNSLKTLNNQPKRARKPAQKRSK